MSQVFFISDTHFFHQKILEFESEKRPFKTVEEMNEAIVDRWNSVVTKRDTVWHLGDVCFGRPENLAIIERLNGKKKLVLGNHDQFRITEYIGVFDAVAGCARYDRFLLSHVPIHPDQFHRFKGNVHGHLHSKRILSGEERMHIHPQTGKVWKVEYLPDTRYINVSCEQNNLTPMAWEDLKRSFTQ